MSGHWTGLGNMDFTNLSQADQIAALQEIVNQQQQIVTQQQSQIASLMANTPTAHSTAESTIPTPVTQPVSATKEARPKERLPTLRVFGGDRNEWEEWQLAAKNKIRADGAAIGDTFMQFLYLSARVEGKAAKTVKTYVEHHSNSASGTGDDFLIHLGNIYADPNKKARALQSLYTMKQGDRESFANFLPRFETVLADAGGHAFSEEQQVNYLRNSLSMKMRPYLISSGQGLSDSYTGFVGLCQNIGSELMALEIYEKEKKRLQSPSHAERMAKAQDAMVWEPTPLSATRTETNGKRATWVDKSAIDFRFQNNLCLRCGNRGHRVMDCKFLPPKNPAGSSRVKVKTAGVKATKAPKAAKADSMDSNGDDKSGDEESADESEKE